MVAFEFRQLGRRQEVVGRLAAPHLRGLVARLTRTHESAAGEPTPWRMADSPAEYIDMMLAAIVGIDVVIERVVGKCKLSQNREARDRLGAAEALGRRGHETIAEAMRTA